jgi:hypothetical protein
MLGFRADVATSHARALNEMIGRAASQPCQPGPPGVAASFIAGLVWWAITDDKNGGGILLSVVFAALIVYLIRRSRGGTMTTPGTRREG